MSTRPFAKVGGHGLRDTADIGLVYLRLAKRSLRTSRRRDSPAASRGVVFRRSASMVTS